MYSLTVAFLQQATLRDEMPKMFTFQLFAFFQFCKPIENEKAGLRCLFIKKKKQQQKTRSCL